MLLYRGDLGREEGHTVVHHNAVVIDVGRTVVHRNAVVDDGHIVVHHVDVVIDVGHIGDPPEVRRKVNDIVIEY